MGDTLLENRSHFHPAQVEIVSISPGKLRVKPRAKVDLSVTRRYHSPMPTPKPKERNPTPAEQRERRFMGARLRDNEQRYREFLETLDPRERERLALVDRREE